MSITSFFGFTRSASVDELPEIFPLSINLDDFVDTDVLNVYSRILTDCVERTSGIPKEALPLLWDNCLQSEATFGLITLLATAMTDKAELFLVYDAGISLLREATSDEATKIKADYKAQGESKVGIYVSFKNYTRTDMVKVYSSMEYAVIGSLNKAVNLSKAIQFKMDGIRSSVSLTDKDVAIEQAKTVAKSLRCGKDVVLDGKDIIETGTPDISSTKEAITFLDAKRSFYYNMPLSYINGEQTAGIGSTGEADTKAVERGLKQYYISILKPVVEALFGVETSFKSNDFRQIGSALEAVKTFELISDELISKENKQLIISKMLDIDPEVSD